MSMRSRHLLGDIWLCSSDCLFVVVVYVVNYFAAARITLVDQQCLIRTECVLGDGWDLVVYDHLVRCLSFDHFEINVIIKLLKPSLPIHGCHDWSFRKDLQFFTFRQNRGTQNLGIEQGNWWCRGLNTTQHSRLHKFLSHYKRSRSFGCRCRMRVSNMACALNFTVTKPLYQALNSWLFRSTNTVRRSHYHAVVVS